MKGLEMFILCAVSFVCGMIAGIILLGTTSPVLNKINNLRNECESQLPRNQYCMMQYIPEPKED